jgi:hypothetical protein
VIFAVGDGLSMILDGRSTVDFTANVSIADAGTEPVSFDGSESTSGTHEIVLNAMGSGFYKLQGATLVNVGAAATWVRLVRVTAGGNREVFGRSIAVGEQIVIDRAGRISCVGPEGHRLISAQYRGERYGRQNRGASTLTYTATDTRLGFRRWGVMDRAYSNVSIGFWVLTPTAIPWLVAELVVLRLLTTRHRTGVQSNIGAFQIVAATDCLAQLTANPPAATTAQRFSTALPSGLNIGDDLYIGLCIRSGGGNITVRDNPLDDLALGLKGSVIASAALTSCSALLGQMVTPGAGTSAPELSIDLY